MNNKEVVKETEKKGKGKTRQREQEAKDGLTKQERDEIQDRVNKMNAFINKLII